jgi:drug/metabolite transporter (DMT)-like permease
VTTRTSDHRLGVLLAAGGLVLISLDSLGIRLSEAGSWDAAFWFGVFTAVSMSVVVRVREGIGPVRALAANTGAIVGAGALQAVSTVFFILAVNTTTVSNTVAIIAATPIVAALTGWIVLRETVGLRVALAIGGSAIGILVIVSGSLGAGRALGDLYALIAVIAFSFNVTLWRSHPQQDWTIAIAVSGLIMALVAFVAADPGSVSARALLVLGLLGAVTGPVGRVALATATRYLPAATVGLFTPVETVAASAWAWLFLSEAPPFRTIVGGIVVIAAVLWGTARQN